MAEVIVESTGRWRDDLAIAIARAAPADTIVVRSQEMASLARATAANLGYERRVVVRGKGQVE